MASKVAVVTGANKGIGFGIARGLCKRFSGTVYLTARDPARGQAAVEELKREGLNPEFHQLDVTDPASLARLRDHLKERHGGLDLLVNNAAIAFKNDATEPFAEQADTTTAVNYFALVSTCSVLFPLLRSGARVVNLSSSAGHLSRIPGEELRKEFAASDLTEPRLSALVRRFVDSARNGTNVAEGWGSSAYAVSKVAVSALSFLQSREQQPRGVIVNCVHPGYVDTDMTSHKGPLTITEGAAAALFLSLDSPPTLTGAYVWYDKSIVDWFGKVPNN